MTWQRTTSARKQQPPDTSVAQQGAQGGMQITPLLFCWVFVPLWISAHSLATFEVIATSSAFSNIQESLDACYGQLVRNQTDKCVIVLSASGSPYHESVSIGFRSSGVSEIVAEDNVTWYPASSDLPVISFIADAANWHIHASAGRVVDPPSRLVVRAGTLDVLSLVKISPDAGTNITIGPGVDLHADVGVEAGIVVEPPANYSQSEEPSWTNYEFRGLKFVGMFDSSILVRSSEVRETGSGLTIRDCFFQNSASEQNRAKRE